MVARLAGGVAVPQANAVAATVGDRLVRQFPDTNAGRTCVVYPLKAGPVLPRWRSTAGRCSLWGLIGAVAAAAMGLAPVVMARQTATDSLHTGHETAGRRVGRLRSALVIAQTTLAFVLLAAASLRVVSRQRVLAELTGFRRAGFASTLPLAGNAGASLTIQGREDIPVAVGPDIGWQWVSPGYTEAMGIRLLQGRDLAWSDLERDTHVALVNETLARQNFPGENPIGRRVYFGPIPDGGVPEWHEIVGVVTDVRHLSLERLPDARAYDLFGQHWGRTVSLAVVSPEPPAAVAGLVRDVLDDRDPKLALFALRTTDDLVSTAVASRRVLGALVTGLALAGVVVTLLGIYGLVSFAVTERWRELGIRVALGAGAARIRWLVLGYGLRLVVAGLTSGVAAVLVLGRGISAQLYGLSATSVPVLSTAAAALLAAALVPCAILARRAAGVDPARTLRE